MNIPVEPNFWLTYTKVELLGQGQYGKVYKAQHRNSLELVAAKKTMLDTDGIPATTLREIALLKSVSAHRNVVSLLEVRRHSSNVENHGDSIFMVMEYFETDLQQYLQDYTIGVDCAKFFARQILEGLRHCHVNDVTHRDLKPSNILMDPVTGTLKIADFGLSRQLGFPNTPCSPETVTLLYRAPEILYSAKTYGKPVDIWSAACIFAEMVRNRPLFMVFSGENISVYDIIKEIHRKLGDPVEEDICYTRPDVAIGQGGFPDPESDFSSYVPGLDEYGVDVLKKMLVYNPCRRWTAAMVLQHPYFLDTTELHEHQH